MAEVLTLQGLAKSYGKKQALNGVSFTIEAGQVFGLLGPNGSGKTTTLGIVLGVIRASSGRYGWFGGDTSAAARRRVGALLEQPNFYPWLSGEANLRVFAAVKRLGAQAVGEVLDLVGLTPARGELFQKYSLGMKQRLGLAVALMGRPEVLVLDEPTNGVDAQGIADIRQIITGFAGRGGTVILASHILDEVEKVCSDVAVLKNGVVLKAGGIASVLATKGWLELASSDAGALKAAVGELEPGARIELRGSLLEVYQARLGATELNRQLAAKGIFLSHLVERQPSLESQYLGLVEGATPS